MTGERPEALEADYPLDRLTTIRVGGKADFFATADEEGLLIELLAWADQADIAIAVVGSGSNLLVSDAGFRGLVLKLGGGLAEVSHDGTVVAAGGGARLPSVAAKVASWGLSGLEFGVNIPGTVGGAVRMNANAYGGELGKVLTDVSVCTPSGVEEREPSSLGLRYRGSNLGGAEVVSGARFSLTEGSPDEIKAVMASMREKRKEAQPSGIKTFGSTFVNPSAEEAGGRSAGMLLDEAGCRGLTVGGARLSPKHANFVENFDGASAGDVLAVMAAARRRVREEFGVTLEPEVQILGEVDWPEGWGE